MGSSIRRSSAGRGVALGLAAVLLAAEAPAATFEVDGTADTVDASPGDGICADVAGLCTLRAAIMETNALPGADVVHLPPGDFVLSIPGQGEDGAASGDLDLSGEVTVRGEGADRTTIDADGLDRAIDVSGVVSIEGVTITGGRDLGGVRARGLQGLLARLVLDSVSVRDNEATGAGDGFLAAGGISIELGNLSMQDTTVSGNRGEFGGIAVFGTASIVNSTISTNTGRCRDCPLVPGCTPGGAGALAAVAGTAVIRNAAIVDNDCPTERGGDGWALNAGSGGLFSGEIHLGSSVLAGSLCEFAYTSDGHNLVAGFDCAFSDPTDLYGLDPLLGPLQDNGGPTPTHALLPGSPAIDAIPIEHCNYDDDGDPATPEVPVATDQRAVRRPHGGRCDMGAYERNSCGLGAELAVLLPLLGALRRGLRANGSGSSRRGVRGLARPLRVAALASIFATLPGGQAWSAEAFTAAERRDLIESRFAEPPLIDAFAAAERVPALILLALPAGRAAPRHARWAERAGERAAIAGAADRVLAHLGEELELRHRYRSAPLLAGSLSRNGLRRLRRHPEVVRVGLDEGGEAALLGAVPHVDLDLARSVYPGAGVTVAVLDSGIDASHPDLAGALVGEACFCTGCCPGGASQAEGPGSAPDDYAHGTAVAGVIASAGTLAPLGGAPAADLVAIKVLNSLGRFAYASDPWAALDYVLNERPDVDLVNMSFGTIPFEGDCDANLFGMGYGYWTDQLRAEGVLSFAAAGNQGLANAMSAPACVAGVISVGAVYENGTDGLGDQIAAFSNTSETTDLLAPGTDTSTTGRMVDGGVYPHTWGTSFSTPLTVACAATLLEANPGIHPDRVEAALESSSTRIVDPRNGFDYPRVDCEDAHAFVRGGCADSLDNDRDGGIDMGDSACPYWESPACGLGGELIVAVLLLAARRRPARR